MKETESIALAEGLEEYPKRTIIFGNLVMLLWLALGTLAAYFISLKVAIAYLTVAILVVYFLLRKLVCANCYYYGKWCATGWGKLSALFFPQGNIEKFGTGIGVKLAGPIYGLLSLIPLVFIIISMIQKFAIIKLIVLVLLLGVSFYSRFLSRGKACVNCKMRSICPEAVKGKG